MGREVTFHFGLRLLKSSAVNSPRFTSRLDCEMSGNICKTEINIYAQENESLWVVDLHFCLSLKELCFQFSGWRGLSHGRHLYVKADMNDWAREALMKSCGWCSGSTALCTQKRRTKRGLVDKDRKYVRLEQGPGNGWAHLTLKFNLLAEVDQLFSALHALDILIAILDELQRKTNEQWGGSRSACWDQYYSHEPLKNQH